MRERDWATGPSTWTGALRATRKREASSRRQEAADGRDDFDVSIVICTRDRCEHLKGSLGQIGSAEIPSGWRVELIVVDNGSADGTRALVEAASLPNMPVRYVFASAKGKGHAYNAGIAAARGRAFLLTDDDTRVPHDWIEQMCRPLIEGEADAVQGGVRIAAHLERPWLKGVLRVWVAEVVDPVSRPEGLVGANMAFSRRAAAEAGPFDTTLGPGAAGFFDDTVFGWKVEAAGLKILYRPAIAVEHHFDPDRLSLAAFLGAARRMALSRAIVLERWSSAVRRPTWRELIFPILPGLIIRGATQAARGLFVRAPDPGFVYYYYRLCLWLVTRSRPSA